MLHNYRKIGTAGAFGGLSAVKALYPRMSVQNIEKTLSTFPSYVLHRSAKPIKHYIPIFCLRIRQILSLDLMEVPLKLRNHNRDIKYFLICIDHFTKFAFVHALKTKTAKEVFQAFKKLISQMGYAPMYVERLISDSGSEFTSNLFKSWCKERNISLIQNSSLQHASLSERTIKILKQLIFRYLTFKNTQSFIDQMPLIVQTLNQRPHALFDHTMSPQQAEMLSNHSLVRFYNARKWIKHYPIKKGRKAKFSVGDTVRITLLKNAFSRGYSRQRPLEKYKIRKIDDSKPYILYHLESAKTGEEIRGAFYSNEIVRDRTKHDT